MNFVAFKSNSYT
jgi:hypothetical protein